MKGWEASKGNFVVVEEAELEALEAHDDSRSIEISQFVDVEQVDPIWRDRVYFLVPGATAAQRRPYASSSRRCATPGPVRSAASCDPAASRCASCAAVATRSCSRRCTWSRTSTRTPRSPRRRRDGGQGARARARPPDHRQPRRRLRPGGADELPTGATCGRCSRPSWRARSCRRRASRSRRRRRRATCSTRSRRASRRRRGRRQPPGREDRGEVTRQGVEVASQVEVARLRREGAPRSAGGTLGCSTAVQAGWATARPTAWT